MISLRGVKSYCCDDISLIENYNEAINDQLQIWACHHRLETDANMSQKELIEKNLYYNRPANELIFLTPSEHQRLHIMFSDYHPSEETRKKMSISAKNRKPYSEETRRKKSEVHKGEKNGMYGKSGNKHPLYGKHWKLENGRRVYY